MNKSLTIAIDGPVGSGKGTLSVALSKKLGILYLYTGGMYRALTLACIRKGVNLSNEEAVLGVLTTCNLHLKVSSGDTEIYLGDENVTEAIIKPEISNQTPIVASHPMVREEMVKRQKEIVEGHAAIIEGRDIATVVAPNAEVKIFLTASLEARSFRRFEQFKERGIQKTYEEVLSDTRERDTLDETRETSPLERHKGTIEIDTTADRVDQTVAKVMDILKERQFI
jgi:cytidylate kinase